MSEADFWACTPRFFAAKAKAYIHHSRRDWERARFTGWLAGAPPVIKGGMMRVTDAYLFEWEAETPRFEPVDLEAMRKFEEDAKRIFEKQFGAKFDTTPAQPAMNGNN